MQAFKSVLKITAMFEKVICLDSIGVFNLYIKLFHSKLWRKKFEGYTIYISTPHNDNDLISPHSITARSNIMVMRAKIMITN